MESATVLQKKASVLSRACSIPKIAKTPELAGSGEHATLGGLDVCRQRPLPPRLLELGQGRGADLGTPALAGEHWAMPVGTESAPAAAPIAPHHPPAAPVKQLDEGWGIALPPPRTFCGAEPTARDGVTQPEV